MAQAYLSTATVYGPKNVATALCRRVRGAPAEPGGYKTVIRWCQYSDAPE